MTRRRSTSTSDRSPYHGQIIAVGTRHGKQHQFAPAFSGVLGARLHTPPDLDTDRFGTFTGETTRAGTPVDAARAKARLAMTVAGLPYGLASEASYGPLPGGWFGHEELLLFCDDRLGIEVLEGWRTTGVPATAQHVAGPDDVDGSLQSGLPDQALIVRPSGGTRPITKGITAAEALRRAIVAAISASPEHLAVVEPDLRAHHNPSRRLVLTRLADRLAHRLATPCPCCRTPGFGRVDAEPGLPCAVCTTPTPLVHRVIDGCAACRHRVARQVADSAGPHDCPVCNP